MRQKHFMRNFIVALAFLLLLTSCSVHSNTTNLKNLRKNQSRGYFTQLKGGGADSFTLMIYMNGGKAEEDYAKATKAIDAMREVDLSDKLTVVIETGGVDVWQNDFLSNEGSDRILLNSKGFSLLSGTKLSSEMDDTTKLSDFVEKTKLEFPADRYGLIFWGDAPLSANEISSVLKEQALDFIGFDGPSNASFELSYLLEPCADYVIGQTGSLATGWDYAALLTTISANTSIPTTDIAKTISTGLQMNTIYTLTGSSSGLYCADLTEAKHVAKTILATYDALADIVLQGNFEQVSALRQAAAYDAKFVYINTLAKNATVDTALDMQTALSSMLRYKDSDTQTLTMYFPTNGFSQVAQELGIYEAAGLPYRNFVATYMSVCLGAEQFMADAANTVPKPNPSPSPSAPAPSGSDIAPSASVSATQVPSTALSASADTTASLYDWYLPDVAESYKNLYAGVAVQLVNPELQAQENLVSIKNTENSFSAISQAKIDVYLQIDGQNLALGATQLLLEEGVYQKSFSDEWLSINGQIANVQALTGDEQGYLLCPVLKDGKPANLFIAQSATDGTYEVLGLLLQQGPYVEFFTPEKGNVIQFQFDVYNSELTYIRNSTHGITLTVADKLTAAPSYVSGDVYVRAITQDIFGVTRTSELVDLRLLLTQTPTDGSDASVPPTQ